MVDFVVNIRSKLVWDPPRAVSLISMVGPVHHTTHRELCPQTPGAFGLNPSSELVIGYHWLAFLNQARKYLKSTIHYEC